jgi:hypothetical protein
MSSLVPHPSGGAGHSACHSALSVVPVPLLFLRITWRRRAVISEETFTQVQAKLDANQQTTLRNTRHEYLPEHPSSPTTKLRSAMACQPPQEARLGPFQLCKTISIRLRTVAVAISRDSGTARVSSIGRTTACRCSGAAGPAARCARPGAHRVYRRWPPAGNNPQSRTTAAVLTGKEPFCFFHLVRVLLVRAVHESVSYEALQSRLPQI